MGNLCCKPSILKKENLNQILTQKTTLKKNKHWQVYSEKNRKKLANVNTLQDVVNLIRNSKKIIILTGKKMILKLYKTDIIALSLTKLTKVLSI